MEDQEFRIRKLETDVEEATKLSYQLRVANHDLLNEARRDPLTGLANRRALEENLAREIARHARHKLPMGALFVDIDRFKNLNDFHGHVFGDLVLKTVAAALTEAVRQEDLVARYGGEEFVVIVVNAGKTAVQLVAERVRGQVEKRGKNEAGTLSITVSVGAAFCETLEDSLQAEFLIAAADSAMYDAKKSGRNKVYFVHVASNTSG